LRRYSAGVHRTRIKLCGMTTPDDALAAAGAGADAVGMILHAPKARRLISLDAAAAIIKSLPPYVDPVGVFVDAGPFAADAVSWLGLSTAQFHGDESPADVDAAAPARVLKAVKMHARTIAATLANWRSSRPRNLAGLLLEAPTLEAGGTGVANDFGLIKRLQDEDALAALPPIIVSGGLTPGNVGDVVRLLRPYAVDVSSGIEGSVYGRKDVKKMQDFVAAVRDADASA
jgi:phosphoribosylanthranilate isomerase